MIINTLLKIILYVASYIIFIMKQILIINGHPEMRSLCTEMAMSYQKGAEASGASCKLVHLSKMNFDPLRHLDYMQLHKLEPDLVEIQKDIKNADHLVLVYPNWWGTYPALLKGFIDRTFLPDFAFKYRKNSLRCDKLLLGKTARLIVTINTPKWYYYLYYGRPGHRSMKKNILEFCGIKPVKISTFGPVKTAHEYKIKGWLKNVERLGQKMK